MYTVESHDKAQHLLAHLLKASRIYDGNLSLYPALSEHLGNVLPLYINVVYELVGFRSELSAARQKMATWAMWAVGE